MTSAARAEAAVELLRRHRQTLRRTARRYSLCEDDADDALQRAIEIVLTKAPTSDPGELIRWTQTVTKHEALAVRRSREKLLGAPAGEESGGEWVETLAGDGADPAERSERREAIARSREALQTLKPDELRALTLLAEGYSYAEIGAIARFSATKVNRCLAEGRERFRRVLSDSEGGRRCAELRPLLSALCDGELAEVEATRLREHLRACGNCRATLRAYRAAPRTVAALAPTLPLGRPLLERLHDLATGLAGRLPGRGAETDAALSQIAAAGGSRGAGAAALAKLLAVCAGTAGGAACAATGLLPAPLDIPVQRELRGAAIERPLSDRAQASWSSGVVYEDDPAPEPSPEPVPVEPAEPEPEPVPEPTPAPPAPEASAGAVEYAPPATPPPAAPMAAPGSASSGSAAGEFGP